MSLSCPRNLDARRESLSTWFGLVWLLVASFVLAHPVVTIAKSRTPWRNVSETVAGFSVVTKRVRIADYADEVQDDLSGINLLGLLLRKPPLEEWQAEPALLRAHKADALVTNCDIPCLRDCLRYKKVSPFMSGHDFERRTAAAIFDLDDRRNVGIGPYGEVYPEDFRWMNPRAVRPFIRPAHLPPLETGDDNVSAGYPSEDVGTSLKGVEEPPYAGFQPIGKVILGLIVLLLSYLSCSSGLTVAQRRPILGLLFFLATLPLIYFGVTLVFVTR
jgi:hypothetical protein